ncbi:MAG: hypothetical protein AAFP84_08660 [Actinomycetota bacterium]
MLARSVALLVLLLALVACTAADDDTVDAPSTTRTPDASEDGDDPSGDDSSGDASDEPDADTDGSDPQGPRGAGSDALRVLGRIDIAASGNRVIDGAGDLLGAPPRSVDIGATPVWIAPASLPDSSEPSWLVVDDVGATRVVNLDGNVTPLDLTIDPDAGPPVFVRGATWSSPDPRLEEFTDPLPDSRVVTDELDRIAVALVDPTDRYPHGVLGDRLEAGAIGVTGGLDAFRETEFSIVVDAPDVIEAVSPMLADVDDDGVVEIVVTVSNADDGARLVAFEVDGSVAAESEPIGQGNRWRNLLAVATTGPSGETEVIDVRTPHIGGTLQFFQLVDGRLERVATADGYSTHAIGSRNLDSGIVTDADGDGRLDVVLPTQDRSELHAIARTDESPTGTEIVGMLPFDAPISTNVAAQPVGPDDEPDVVYAVGTADGTIHLLG